MKKVYIVLSQTGTLFSKAIRWHTKDPYNHASLSFDPGLEVMYSFGRRKKRNFLDNGLVMENFNKGIYLFFPNAKCCILEIEVSEDEYEAMEEAVKYFCDNWKNYRYNFIGVLSFAMGVGVKRKNRFFCSQFVSFILGHAHFWNLSPELTKPMDFLDIPDCTIAYEGGIAEFKALHMPKRLLTT